MTPTQELIERLKATLPSQDDPEWADAAQYWCSELSMQDVIDTVAALERMHKALEGLLDHHVKILEADLARIGEPASCVEFHLSVQDARRALNGET